MIGWCFAGIALIAAFAATFIGNVNRALLALWVAGLAIGALYITLGVEVLAIIQWVISTLVTISFMFFSAMFGEHRPVENLSGENKRPDSKRLVMAVFALTIGLGFAAVVQLGFSPSNPVGESLPSNGNDLFALGRELTENHLLSLEVLAFTLFLALVGGGMIARPEGREGETEAESTGRRGLGGPL